MRISLVYNETAGEGVSGQELRRELRVAGHRVVNVLADAGELAGVRSRSIDLVVAAGGDGTISRTAAALAGRRIPLAILPLGTANNIARSLGIQGSLHELIAGWPTARRVPLDLGRASGKWGQSRFVESVGGGLLPRAISVFDGEPEPEAEETPPQRVARAVRRYRDVLIRLKPRPWTLTVDGARVEGEFLLVEVLNTRLVGPNLELSPVADSSDGHLDVITVGEGERRALDAYLESCAQGSPRPPSLPCRRAREVDTEHWGEMHIDDELRWGADVENVSIRVEPAAVDYLVGTPVTSK